MNFSLQIWIKSVPFKPQIRDVVLLPLTQNVKWNKPVVTFLSLRDQKNYKMEVKMRLKLKKVKLILAVPEKTENYFCGQCF